MEILKGIEIKNKALWIRKEKLLVIGDLHLGYEESLNEQGVSIPRINFEELLNEIKKLLKLKPKKVILLGDLQHEFGKIFAEERENLFRLIKTLNKSSDLVVIRGNHDKMVGPILKNEKIIFRDSYFIKDFCFLHGNFIPKNKDFKKAKIIFMGHEHPAIELNDGIKKEKYKCFLSGNYKNKKLIVLPSFFSIVGTDVLIGKFLSPFLRQSLDNFEVFVVFHKAFYFGKIKKIKESTKAKNLNCSKTIKKHGANKKGRFIEFE